MQKFFNSTLFVLLFISSCKIKNSINKVDVHEIKESAPPEEYFKIREGFVLATIVNDFETKGCPFLIKIEDVYYQVVDLDSTLNVNKLKIWIKYTPSKIVLKDCKIGVPIILNEFYVSEKQ